MLDEAVERNEQSIRRIQSRIERLEATLNELEDLQSTFGNGKSERQSRQRDEVHGMK